MEIAHKLDLNEMSNVRPLEHNIKSFSLNSKTKIREMCQVLQEPALCGKVKRSVLFLLRGLLCYSRIEGDDLMSEILQQGSHRLFTRNLKLFLMKPHLLYLSDSVISSNHGFLGLRYQAMVQVCVRYFQLLGLLFKGLK